MSRLLVRERLSLSVVAHLNVWCISPSAVAPCLSIRPPLVVQPLPRCPLPYVSIFPLSPGQVQNGQEDNGLVRPGGLFLHSLNHRDPPHPHPAPCLPPLRPYPTLPARAPRPGGPTPSGLRRAAAGHTIAVAPSVPPAQPLDQQKPLSFPTTD